MISAKSAPRANRNSYTLTHIHLPRSILLLVIFAGALPCQTSLSTQQRLADVQYVATQLPALHPNFFFQLNPAEFNTAVQLLKAQVADLTDAEFAVRLAQLVAMPGDPHTLLYLRGPTFPITLRTLDDGIFVTGAAQEYSKALGTRLIAVGTTDVATVLTKLGTVIPHTNSQWVNFEAQSFLRVQATLQGLDLVPAASPSPLTFQDSAGNLFTLNVTPSSEELSTVPSPEQGPLPEFVQSADKNYWFTYFAPQRLLYLKYNVCEDDPANPFATLAANLLHTFDTNPVDTFVLDFRGNTGGNSLVIDPVLNGLQQRLLAMNNPAFRFYDVIDGGTFSSGLDDAMEIKSNSLIYAKLYPGLGLEKSIVVIGEPSGGPPASYGEVKTFTLPYLGLSGQYSTVYHSLQQYIPAGNAFHPDVSVSNRSTDYFARHDPILAAIFARAGAPPASPTGGTIVVSAASFRTDQGIAPGSYAAAFGTFPFNVDGVYVNGDQAQIAVATASQINFVLPVGAKPGTATISVRVGPTEVANGQFTVTPESLSLFAISSEPSQPGGILNSDSTINSADAPALQDSFIQIYGTGFAQSTQVLFAETPAMVLFSGPVLSVAGLWQMNVTVPSAISGQLPIYAIAGSMASNAVTVWVK